MCVFTQGPCPFSPQRGIMICMGLITTLLVFDIANKAASIDESLKEKYTPEEEETLMAATLTGVFFTVFWPFAIAWPSAPALISARDAAYPDHRG